MTRISAIARGFGSLALLLGLLIGAPLALTSWVGWPLPTSAPDISSLERALRSGISDDVIVKTLAVIAWIAWAQIALAITAEVVAVARRRPSVHLPVMPGFQAAAGRLVASVAMMAAALSPTAAMASPAPPTPVVALVAPAAAPVEVVTAAPPAAPDPTPAATPQVARPTVVVERHDSFWAIAERILGDGYRWREIRDLNVGRTMNTGDVIQPGSDLVHPGWILELPTDATPGLASPVATNTPVETSEVTVEPGDSFWSLAEEQLAASTGVDPTDGETAPYWFTMIEANQDRLVQPGNPNLILPGQQLCAPAVPGAQPAGGPVLTEPPAHVETPVPSEHAPPVSSEVEPPRDDPPPTLAVPSTQLVPAPTVVPPVEQDSSPHVEKAAGAPVAIVGAGMLSAVLAVGATRTVRRRRRQASTRTPGISAAPTPDDARDLHRLLLAEADDLSVDDLRRCLGELAQALAATGTEARPRIIQHGSDHLDVFLQEPNDSTPEGWQSHNDGALWTLRNRSAVDPECDEICAAPLLITLGRPDEDGQLYLDLEAEGLIALTGDPEAATGIARSLLAELAFTPLADTLEVIVIGDLAPPEAKTLDHVTITDSWNDVLDDVKSWAQHTHEALVENGWPSAFVARGADPLHDALAPVAVIATTPPPPELVEHLTAHQPATLAVVAVGEIPGATTLHCAAESLTVVDVDLTCSPFPLDEDTLEDLIDLVEEADQVPPPDEQLPLLPPEVLIEPDPEGPDASLTEPEVEVLVRTLGEIRVDGGEPLSPKQTAVVAYIAVHGTVSADRLEDAVWASPGTTSRRKRLANTISECRAAIGQRHLPPAADGKYSAGLGLVSDLDLFDVRIKRAAEQAAGMAADSLLSAMELVTGPPFTYRSADRASFAWVEVENWVSRWELKIAAVAERCTDLLLDLGRTEEAVEAARHALGIVPTHAALTEALMRAHAANGDRLAVQRVYQEHVGALEALDLDAPEDSTTDLYDQLVDARSA